MSLVTFTKDDKLSMRSVVNQESFDVQLPFFTSQLIAHESFFSKFLPARRRMLLYNNDTRVAMSF
ncbi:MAG TPA: hypothetical protein DCL56_05095, partial [Lactobacillus sp.]|nr:hypothetical protein [Lactobacillus sp.]